MVTVSKGTAAKGASYFAHDDVRAGENYYTAQAGMWYGSGAEALGLRGVVQKEEFFKVLKGTDLTGKIALTRNAQKTDEENKRVAYTDVTISAPKSVSLISVIDPRVKDAHRKAVEVTLAELEENYSLTRTGTNGVNQYNTGSMAIAAFEHEESRDLDVQLHTHCVIVNATKRKDGKWGALENRPILQDQKLLDLTYQAHLARELNFLGYETVRSTRKGKNNKEIDAVEIVGVSDELIDQNSMRSKQVKKNAEERSEAWENLEQQYLEGRINKKNYTMSKRSLITYDKMNSRKSKDLESSLGDIAVRRNRVQSSLADFKIPKECPLVNSSYEVKATVKSAVESIAETEAVFDKKMILKTALLASIGTGITAKDIASEIKTFTVELSPNAFTTQEIIDSAHNAIAIAKAGKGRAVQLSSDATIEKYLRREEIKGVTFAQTQRDTIKTLCRSNDMVNILQGNAGTGKTFAVTHMKAILEQDGFVLRGLAPTGKASAGLAEAGLESSTLDSFFMKNQEIARGKEVWIVDECSMVGNVNMAKLLKKAEANHAKVILLGDVKQLQAVSAGRAFGELQEFATVTRSDMAEVVRQKNELMKSVVALSTEQRGHYALSLIAEKTGVRIIANQEDRLKTAVASVFETRKSGQSVVLLAQTNEIRTNANELIRKELISRGEIGESQQLWTLANTGASAPARLNASSYRKNYLVNFSREVAGIPSGTQARVESVDIAKNAISVSYRNRNTQKDELTTIPVGKLGSSLQIYSATQKEFGIGDEIIFLKNDKGLGVSNGLTGKIADIDSNGKLRVQVGNNYVTFGKNQYRYFDYAYAMTNHKAQGATYDQAVILCDDSGRTNAEEWYVGVTRARHGVIVITDNLETMKERVQVSQPKESVLDHSGLDNRVNSRVEELVGEKNVLRQKELAEARKVAEQAKQAELAKKNAEIEAKRVADLERSKNAPSRGFSR